MTKDISIWVSIVLLMSSHTIAQPFEIFTPGTQGQKVFSVNNKYILAGRDSEYSLSNGVIVNDVSTEGSILETRFFNLSGFNYNQTRNAGNYSYANEKFYVSLLLAENNDAQAIPAFIQFDSNFSEIEAVHSFPIDENDADFLRHYHFSDSTVMALGHLYEQYGRNDALLVNFNLNGNVNWIQNYGFPENCRTTPTSLVELNENEFMLSFNRYHNYNGSSSGDYQRVTLRKMLKSTGQWLWQKSYGQSNYWQEGGPLLKLEDGRVFYSWTDPKIIGPTIDQFNPLCNIYWAEIDEANGDEQLSTLLWQIPNNYYRIRSARQLGDGNIILAGDYLGGGYTDDNSFFILKMTADAEVEWFRRVYVLDDITSVGTSLNVFFLNDIELIEEGFLVAGTSVINNIHNPSLSGYKAVLIRLDEHGCLEPGCQYALSDESYFVSEKLMIFPNPTTDVISIQSSVYPFSNLRVVDLMGKVVLNVNVGEVREYQLDLSDVSNGTYILNIDLGFNIETHRIIKY